MSALFSPAKAFMSTRQFVFKRLYMIYGMAVFGGLFLLLFIPFLVPIAFPKYFRWATTLNRWWSKSLFFCIAMPWRVSYRAPLSKRKKYILCPNHFSWLDIPTMGLYRGSMVFVGKSEIASVPFFGWMYRRLHTSIDRGKMMSMRSMLRQASDALDQGKTLCIFPEGGIRTASPPHMAQLKEGAFRVAIAKQIPIVPVTIPNNWILLPKRPMLLTWGRVEAIFHQPIEVKGMTLDDVGLLKEKVHAVIDRELSGRLSR